MPTIKGGFTLKKGGKIHEKILEKIKLPFKAINFRSTKTPENLPENLYNIKVDKTRPTKEKETVLIGEKETVLIGITEEPDMIPVSEQKPKLEKGMIYDKDKDAYIKITKKYLDGKTFTELRKMAGNFGIKGRGKAELTREILEYLKGDGK